MKIYLISSRLNDNILYKIGITKRDVAQRLKELKTGNAAELSVINIFESKWASKIEANLHTSLKSKGVSGEWFSLDKNDIDTFTIRCQLIHDNFELLNKSNTWFIDKNKQSHEF